MDTDLSRPGVSLEEEPDESLTTADAHTLLEIAATHRIAVDVANDPIIMVDNEGKIALWNKAAEKLFGYPAHEALGRDVHALITPQRYLPASTQAFNHFKTTGEGAALGKTLELAGIRKGGTEFPLELSLAAESFQGKWVAVATVRDITAHKQAGLALQQSEAKFRAILDSSPVAHALSDAQGNVTLLNSAFIRAFGYTREDIPNLAAWWAKAYPDPEYSRRVKTVWRDHLEKAKREGIEFEPLEVNVYCKDGRVRTVLVSAVSLGDSSGDAHLAIFYDITERKVAEQQIELKIEDIAKVNAQLVAANQQLGHAQNQLLQSEKMASIGLLAAGVAHEINNPIGYVYSNLGTLEKYLTDIFAVVDKYEAAEHLIDCHTLEIEELRLFKAQIDLDYLREDIRSLLAESREGLMRVKKIVADLKDFSHTGSEEEWKWVDIHQGLESTLSVVWNELKYKCEVIKEYGQLPLIQCLPSQLNQVFMNLLVNAAQAIEERGVVTIRTGVADDQVWVEVGDTGKGIAPENMQRLFDPFFTTKPVGQGTGLGLSVSYSIVEKHHGRFEVNSVFGKDAQFRVWLPVRQTDEVAPA
ncbi:MAG: PAS domain S-box protein [Proteobacteria bacterium]|nr:PAS domain S-box protein [Pseudomonadota bacterium]